MNISVKAPHMDVTEPLKQYVSEKIAKLPHYYTNVHSIEVILDIEGQKPFVEIVVTAARKATFVASHRDDDMYACVDQCLHKITEQLRRHKDKVRDRQAMPHENRIIERTEE